MVHTDIKVITQFGKTKKKKVEFKYDILLHNIGRLSYHMSSRPTELTISNIRMFSLLLNSERRSRIVELIAVLYSVR